MLPDVSAYNTKQRVYGIYCIYCMLSSIGTVEWIVPAMLSGKWFIPIEQTPGMKGTLCIFMSCTKCTSWNTKFWIGTTNIGPNARFAGLWSDSCQFCRNIVVSEWRCLMFLTQSWEQEWWYSHLYTSKASRFWLLLRGSSNIFWLSTWIIFWLILSFSDFCFMVCCARTNK